MPQALALLIIAATFAIFWPAVGHTFMLIDDPDYITDHPLVPLGLTWTGVGYAFVARHSGNWHPLATLSHMLDCQLFGLNPAGHHLVNILFHALNAALVFWVFRKMTGSLWRSFFVAAFLRSTRCASNRSPGSPSAKTSSAPSSSSLLSGPIPAM